MDAIMIRAYLRQVLMHHSTSKGEMLLVAEMAPRHCANAATNMLRQAEFWHGQALSDSNYPELWMTQQPLFQALAKRGAEEA